jgi:hypothetical protein
MLSAEVVPIMPMRGLRRVSPSGVSKNIVENLKAFLDELTKADGLTPQNIIYNITLLMQQVGKYKNLSGIDKKNVVLYVIDDFVNSSEVLSSDPTLKLAIKSMAPSVIDTLINAAKGKYKFKVKIRAWFGCCC